MERFKLESSQHVRDLSKGEGTRIRLITAMVFRPRVLVLGELVGEGRTLEEALVAQGAAG